MHARTSTLPIVSAVQAAITAHRAAYDAFQAAPEGRASEHASDAYSDASMVLVAAVCGTGPDALALFRHLMWWLREEAEFAEGHQPAYGIAMARAKDLSFYLGALVQQVDLPPAMPSGRLAARIYSRHAVKDRAHMAGELAEEEWLPSYQATVALMEKLEATQPKTLLGAALKCLGAIGLAGWNARADGSTDGMDPWERVGVQFQDALMADALAPISILGPDLVGLVNFSAATMEELRAVYEVADELGTAGHAQAWVGRSKVRGSSQDLNPAGRLAQWVGDALSDVVSTAISEARGRIPATDDDRRIRFEILARSIFQNDDPAGGLPSPARSWLRWSADHAQRHHLYAPPAAAHPGDRRAARGPGYPRPP